jgi:hypothetical protein
MATTKKDDVIQDVMEAVQQSPDTDERISRFIADQGAEFPDAASIDIDFKYQNPFEIPAFLNQKDYKYAWLDPQDDIQMFNSLERNYFKIVTRSSSCILDAKKAEPYFRFHGAIELQRMILGFRPTEIDNRMRQAPAVQHKQMVEAMEGVKETEAYNVSFDKFRGDFDKKGDIGKMTEVVYEEPAGG